MSIETRPLDERAANLPRAAFVAYARTTLEAILAVGELRRGGTRLRPNGFTLRTLDPAEREPMTLESANVIEPAEVLDAHVRALIGVTIPETGRRALPAARWTATVGAVTRAGSWEFEPDDGPDFVFRYPVVDTQPTTDLAGYLACVLAIVLDVVDLHAPRGEEVVPDAVTVGGATRALPLASALEPWRLGSRVDGVHGTGARQPLHSVAASEPAIVVIARHWGLLASLLRIGAGGGGPPGDDSIVRGFRLRRLTDWLIPTGGHPSEIYEYLARVCNVSCTFCYLHGNPEQLAVARGSKIISRDEIDTRMRYFDPAGGRSLFRAQWEINEFLIDRKMHEVLPRLRCVTDEPFYFITNGNPLNEKTLDLLERVKPVHLIVSVNTLDEDLRAEVMRERKRQTTTAYWSLRELGRRRIPFGVSLAAFPDFPLDDLRRTIARAEELGAAFVRVNLPGFTRQLPYPEPIDTDAHWAMVTDALAATRCERSVPLIVIPSAFEEGRHPDPLAARVIGTVPGSPAATSGLEPGDVVEHVNGFEIETRADLHALLPLMRGTVTIAVRRGARRVTCTFDADDVGTHPYDGHIMCKYVFPYGVVMSPALSPRVVGDIHARCEEVGARSLWILSSPIMASTARALLDRHAPGLRDIARLVVVTCEFLGGNIAVMDMCTVSDIARAVARELQEAGAPDLIVLADSGFNDQGRDLEGRHWGDLERWLGIPVRLVSVTRFSY